MANIYILEQDIKDILEEKDSTINKLEKIAEIILDYTGYNNQLVFNHSYEILDYLRDANYEINEIFSDYEIGDFIKGLNNSKLKEFNIQKRIPKDIKEAINSIYEFVKDNG